MFGFAWLISKAKFRAGLDEAARLALEFYLIIDVTAYRNDRVAQLVARFLDMEEVAGSSPATITKFFRPNERPTARSQCKNPMVQPT